MPVYKGNLETHHITYISKEIKGIFAHIVVIHYINVRKIYLQNRYEIVEIWFT